jgi:hypothetical protein
MRFVSQWRMPLLFLISGAPCIRPAAPECRAVSPGSGRRICCRWHFGMFVVVPPQIYFERLTQGHTYVTLGFTRPSFG